MTYHNRFTFSTVTYPEILRYIMSRARDESASPEFEICDTTLCISIENNSNVSFLYFVLK
jgi:hypothetical protein